MNTYSTLWGFILSLNIPDTFIIIITIIFSLSEVRETWLILRIYWSSMKDEKIILLYILIFSP